MVFVMMRWWYTRGWALCMQRIERRVSRIAEHFSAGQLLGSLFAPWHRIVAYGGRNINERFQDAISNGISRLVGFVIRFFVLITSALVLLGTFVLGIIEIIAWPVVPLAFIYCVVRGISG